MHKKTALLCFLALFFFLPSKATHVMGAYISYEALDTFRYEVKVVFYRDCRGVAFSNPSSQTHVSCAGTTSRSLTLSLESIEEITPIGPNSSGGCTPANTYGTGFGVEKHTYTTILDLNQAGWTSYKNCCELIISTGQCCRNGAINTGPSGNFYTYTAINVCESSTNSSPQVVFDPVNYLCCNQPVYQSYGIIDSVDGDSLSFAWAEPLRGYGATINYSGGYYAYNHPFQVYYPGALTPPYYNYYANPPIGLYLDEQTGQVTFTPTRCDEVTVAVIEVKEWRADTNGVRKIIGSMRVDMEFIVQTCTNNNPPELHVQQDYYVCKGDSICFDVRTSDVRYIPPPPDTARTDDSTFLSWSHGIENASVTLIDTSRDQGARFCWQTTDSTARSHPYIITFQVRDNADSLYRVATKAVKIHVFEQPDSNLVFSPLGCGSYRITSTVLDAEVVNFIQRDVLDSTGQAISDTAGVFLSGVSASSDYQAEQYVRFTKSGTYIIRSRGCPNDYFDTIVVSQPFQVLLNVEDTSVCVGSFLDIRATYDPTMRYQWFRDGDSLHEDTTYRLLLDIEEYSAHDYWVSVEGADSCSSSKTIRVSAFPQVAPRIADTVWACGDTIEVSLDSIDVTRIAWNNGSREKQTTYIGSGNYFVDTWDKFGCRETQYFDAIANFKPELELKDTAMCLPYYYLDPGYPGEYLWNNSIRQKSIYITKTDTLTLRVRLHGCDAHDTAYIVMDQQLEIDARDTIVCQTDMTLELQHLLDTTNLADGINQWTCLDCNGNSTNSMVYNTGGSGLGAELRYDNSYYSVNGDKDTIVLELRNWKSSTCIAYDTMNVVVVKRPDAPVLVKVNPSKISADKQPVQWYIDGTPIGGESDSILVVWKLGSYSARYTDSFGCISELSNTISKTAGIGPIDKLVSTAYPVPAFDRLFLDVPSAQLSEVQLTNSIGQSVDFQQVISEKFEIRFDLPNGIYYLHAQYNELELRIPFMIVKE